MDTRIIPARAGNTLAAAAEPEPAADHPRTGGEHDGQGYVLKHLIGSSPHGRGTPGRGRRFPLHRRIIPARAGNTHETPIVCPADADHPRTGGEHAARLKCAAQVGGSSPHGRGTRGCRVCPRFRPRIIPARAGNTTCRDAKGRSLPDHPRTGGEHACRSTRNSAPADHPRTGGEHTRAKFDEWSVTGSSPHGRGTHRPRQRRSGPRRIIPARAGNTVRRWRPEPHNSDHPRTGGEHAGLSAHSNSSPGSSPHGRGTPLVNSTVLILSRIIPARAGNTAGNRRASGTRPDHPRTGGEHQAGAVNCFRPCGSSPHGRGTRVRGNGNRAALRIIPARAGNTSVTCAVAAANADHPRTGGEHRRMHFADHLAVGSSPHGRGTRSNSLLPRSIQRIIPARAGNTFGDAKHDSQGADHPRTGGEHPALAVTRISEVGSSPHGRGTHGAIERWEVEIRIIPARAGNTPQKAHRQPLPSDHPRTGGEHICPANS